MLKQYEIGELYNQNGIRGVICQLSDDRQHGLVVSLDEIYLHWSEFRKPDLRLAGAEDTNKSDGAKTEPPPARKKAPTPKSVVAMPKITRKFEKKRYICRIYLY